jgi:hypothetical protein
LNWPYADDFNGSRSEQDRACEIRTAEEAKRFDSDAFRNSPDEVEKRPLVMLGAAAGI